MNPPCWTPEEDAILRAVMVVARGPEWRTEASRRLPARSPCAIGRRVDRLGLRRPSKVWTPAENKVLTLCWGETSRRTFLEKLPGRTWVAICSRAKLLGLGPVGGGRVSLRECARQLGYHLVTLREILVRRGVTLTRHPGRPQRTSTAPKTAWLLVDIDDARDAVERELAERRAVETIQEAARRLGVSAPCLRKRLCAAGLLGRERFHAPKRLRPEDVDRAMALWQATHPRAQVTERRAA